jgi:hypothetical protein
MSSFLERPIVKWLMERFSFYLMLALLLVIYIVAPLVFQTALGTFVLQVAFSLLCIAAVIAADPSRWVFRLTLALAVVVFVVGWINEYHGYASHPLWFTKNLVSILFFGMLIFVLLRTILSAGRIDSRTICAALCVYFFIGLIFAHAYTLIHVSNPGAFDVGAKAELVKASASAQGLKGRHGAESMVFLYYSLVTLTTLGYGDITPQSPLAMSLSTTEAFLGQIYIAVLIAWLVGMSISHAMTGKKEEDQTGRGGGGDGDEG